MRTRSVHWCEGMLLLPHHFQAEHAHLLDWTATGVDWTAPYSYGLREIDIHFEALKNFEVRIPMLKARMKDGTLVSVPENAFLGTLDLRPSFQKAQELYLYLLLPEVVPGKANAARITAVGDRRFLVAGEEWADRGTGATTREIDSEKLAAGLVATTELEAPSGYEALPVARFKRAQRADAIPELDTGYIPPLLVCDCWKPLREDILETVFAMLGAHIKRSAEYLHTHGGWQEAHQANIRRAIMLLQEVNSAYPFLVQMIRRQGVHPAAAYAELCRLVGQLSIFLPENKGLSAGPWQPPDLPEYDHDDLGRIFPKIIPYIAAALGDIVDITKRLEFLGVNKWMEVALDPRWLQGDHELFVGVKFEAPLTAQKVASMMAPLRLDFKIGSRRVIEQIFTNSLPGLTWSPVSGTHPKLPAANDLAYFRIDQNGQYWDQVAEDRWLAVMINPAYVGGNFLGTNTIRVTPPNGQYRDLTFYLFVVPPR